MGRNEGLILTLKRIRLPRLPICNLAVSLLLVVGGDNVRTYAKQTLALLRSLAGRDSTSMCYLLRGQAACCLNPPLRPRRTNVLSSAPRLASAILRKSYRGSN